MATYVMSDIHGKYDRFLKMLCKLNFGSTDTLYIVGDVVDRGEQPMELIQDLMGRKNVHVLAGNHDMMAFLCLRKLVHTDLVDDLDEETVEDILGWTCDGGTPTLRDFLELDAPQRQQIVDWLRERDLYQELTVNGKQYVLVHAGLGRRFRPDRPLDDYELEDYLFGRTLDYRKVYFPDKFLVTGHTPTSLIPGNPRRGKIYRENNHIAIDCGCVFGGDLGALCLETGEEFYV